MLIMVESMKRNLRCANIYNKSTKNWMDEGLVNPYCYNFGINNKALVDSNKTTCDYKDI